MTSREVEPIRICFVILNAYPLFNPEAKGVIGGAEVDSYYIASELAKDSNYRVSCIVADYGQEPIEVRESVTLIRALDFNTRRFAATLHLWQALRKADAQIYVRKLSSAVTAEVALFCKRYGRSFVYRTASAVECDGTYIKEHYFRGKGFLWSLRHADAVIAQNQTDADNLAKTAGVGAQVIRNPDRLPPLDHKDRRTILWVGRSADVKRPELFLELAKQIPGQHFTMICQRAIEDKQYEGFVAKAKQIKNLEFIQRVPFHQIHEHFLQAKVFVNTSDYEGFPNTFIQACKCATPVLSLNVNPDGFLDEHECGICCNGDWEKFVDSLRGILQQEQYSELGNNARKYAEENHDISKIVEQYKSCFIKITQNKK
ncbi:MAG: glycosyltransferase [Phycisphaerae bacterium]|nr:glycosyltransferase family 4 protein [Phycisphaerae bacterium]NIP56046.1 glycosyltransferase family 4 protein [Phycisphaerae bacterium]NIS50316.1 glycosyltransferase family 4 protein [Phycisphaerae bacterium]NIU08063.1 glycosyltransferase family 4 protein [Phycisphaerae bacterium]NIU59962.1 glycosyltransferase [Phycisphaerae bacterium]